MAPADSVVRFAYWLDASSGYARFKAFFYDLLIEPRSRRRAWFDIGMILLILASVYLLIYRVHHELSGYAQPHSSRAQFAQPDAVGVNAL